MPPLTESPESDLKVQLQADLLKLRRDIIQDEGQKAKMSRNIPIRF
jgi:hypothetical protein